MTFGGTHEGGAVIDWAPNATMTPTPTIQEWEIPDGGATVTVIESRLADRTDLYWRCTACDFQYHVLMTYRERSNILREICSIGVDAQRHVSGCWFHEIAKKYGKFDPFVPDHFDYSGVGTE